MSQLPHRVWLCPHLRGILATISKDKQKPTRKPGGFLLVLHPARDDYLHTALLRMKKSPPEQDLFLRLVNHWLLARLGQWRFFVLPLSLFLPASARYAGLQ